MEILAQTFPFLPGIMAEIPLWSFLGFLIISPLLAFLSFGLKKGEQPKRGLDKPKGKRYYFLCALCFFESFFLLATFMYMATSRVHYIWRWERVPQYFWISEDQSVTSGYDGTVDKIEDAPSGMKIMTIKPSDGSSPERLELPAGARLLVEQGYTVYYGEHLATHHVSKPGILLTGLWITFTVSLWAIGIGIIVGLVTGLCRISENPALRWWSVLYIEFIRGSPLLVQIFIWYFVVGTVVDELLSQIGLPAIPQFWYGAIALAIFTGAYVAEIVRAGIQSVARGQTEAARSLGMTYWQCMRKVVLPQALRRIMPPLAGQFISLIKDSSLLGVITVRELTKVTREAITSSLQSLELWFVCALLYLALTFALSVFVQYLERRAVRR